MFNDIMQNKNFIFALIEGYIFQISEEGFIIGRGVEGLYSSNQKLSGDFPIKRLN